MGTSQKLDPLALGPGAGPWAFFGATLAPEDHHTSLIKGISFYPSCLIPSAVVHGLYFDNGHPAKKYLEHDLP
jgi:hypothetical protein